MIAGIFAKDSRREQFRRGGQVLPQHRTNIAEANGQILSLNTNTDRGTGGVRADTEGSASRQR
jgi:hypothetical protein